jgi:hypothetical protein
MRGSLRAGPVRATLLDELIQCLGEGRTLALLPPLTQPIAGAFERNVNRPFLEFRHRLMLVAVDPQNQSHAMSHLFPGHTQLMVPPRLVKKGLEALLHDFNRGFIRRGVAIARTAGPIRTIPSRTKKTSSAVSSRSTSLSTSLASVSTALVSCPLCCLIA